MIIKVPGKPGDLAKISHRYDEDFIGKIRDEFTYNYETKVLWLTIEQRKYARAFPSIYIEPLGETESEVVIPDAKDYTGTIEWDYNGKIIREKTYPEYYDKDKNSIPTISFGIEGHLTRITESILPDDFPEIKVIGYQSFSAEKDEDVWHVHKLGEALTGENSSVIALFSAGLDNPRYTIRTRRDSNDEIKLETVTQQTLFRGEAILHDCVARKNYITIPVHSHKDADELRFSVPELGNWHVGDKIGTVYSQQRWGIRTSYVQDCSGK
ncbi:MAG: hypothetical protein ACLR6B_03050 [Blautia sp.]